MGMLYSIFMLLALTGILMLLFGMIGRRWPDMMRALTGRSRRTGVQSDAVRRLIRA